MAELVDALVSNTSGVKSIPVRSRVWVQGKKAKQFDFKHLAFSYFVNVPKLFPIGINQHSITDQGKFFL